MAYRLDPSVRVGISGPGWIEWAPCAHAEMHIACHDRAPIRRVQFELARCLRVERTVAPITSRGCSEQPGGDCECGDARDGKRQCTCSVADEAGPEPDGKHGEAGGRSVDAECPGALWCGDDSAIQALLTPSVSAV